MEKDTIMSDKPMWFAAINGVVLHSPVMYFCNGGFLSEMDEMQACWKNRERVLIYVHSLIGKQEKVSAREISDELGITEEFITFVLEDEFEELDYD